MYFFAFVYVVAGFVGGIWGFGLLACFRRPLGIVIGLGAVLLGLFWIVHGFSILTS